MSENNVLDTTNADMVTVFASSSSALDQVYYDAARHLGEVLARAGKTIMYGAGGKGLMGSVADGALAFGGKVYGVVPGFLRDLELTHNGLTGLTVVEGMRERKQLMLERADAVVALPGGSGTYEELFEALTMKRLGQWLGPIVLVNTNGFYDSLLQFLQQAVDERFMGRTHMQMWSVVDGPEQVVRAFETAHAWNGEALQFANVTPANA